MSRSRNRLCAALAAGLLSLVLSDPLWAQTRSRPGRGGLQLQQRLESRLREDLLAALKLLEQDYGTFAESYLVPEATPRPLPAAEIRRLHAVLSLFAEQPVQLFESGTEAESRVKITPEVARKLSPPPPPKTPPATSGRDTPQAAGYGDDPQRALASAIRDLEAGNHREFLRSMFPLAELERLRASGQEDACLKRFAEDKVQPQLMIDDLRRMTREKPEFTTENGIRYAVYAIETDPRSLNSRDNSYKIERLLSPPPRACILELSGGHWRLHDGNREAREQVKHQRRPGVEEGTIGLRWQRTDAGWRLSEIPFFEDLSH